jgi:hypothetical protein
VTPPAPLYLTQDDVTLLFEEQRDGTFALQLYYKEAGEPISDIMTMTLDLERARRLRDHLNAILP